MARALSELAQVNPKVGLPADAHVALPVSFIPMSDVSESGAWTGNQVRLLADVRNGFTVFADGDVLVAKITPCFENGKGAHVLGLTNGVGFGSTEFHVLRARSGVSNRYLHHVVHGTKFRTEAEAFMTGSAGQKRVPREAFDRFQVPDLSLPEQAKIAEILDTLDTTLRQTEAIIEKLKQVKQGLLHDLLTRGMDANGELRPPQSQSPHLYKDSPLGWIPSEWHASNVVSEFDVTSGITLGPHRVPRSHPRRYLRVANVQRARLDLSDVAELEASNAEIATRELAPGDLLVVEGHASTEEIGRCAMAGESVRGFTFQNHLFRLRATRLIPTFALEWMNSSLVRAYWRTEAATSSGLNTINRTKLNRVLVAAPSGEEQRRIVTVIDSMDQRLASEASQLAKLRMQKSGLTDDLLTGRVRVTPLLAAATP